MDAMQALHTRNSVALLTEPGPTENQLENIFLAATKANDHGRLRPWKFLIIDGANRESLGAMMASIAVENNPEIPIDKQKGIASKPLRAPLIIVVVACIQKDSPIPEIEQLLSAAGAAQLAMAAAHAQDVGAIWRTGSLAYDPRLVTGLGFGESDRIVGFLYMGKPKSVKPLSTINLDDHVVRWRPCGSD